jgi:hypothetical protein
MAKLTRAIAEMVTVSTSATIKIGSSATEEKEKQILRREYSGKEKTETL